MCISSLIFAAHISLCKFAVVNEIMLHAQPMDVVAMPSVLIRVTKCFISKNVFSLHAIEVVAFDQIEGFKKRG